MKTINGWLVFGVLAVLTPLAYFGGRAFGTWENKRKAP